MIQKKHCFHAHEKHPPSKTKNRASRIIPTNKKWVSKKKHKNIIFVKIRTSLYDIKPYLFVHGDKTIVLTPHTKKKKKTKNNLKKEKRKRTKILCARLRLLYDREWFVSRVRPQKKSKNLVYFFTFCFVLFTEAHWPETYIEVGVREKREKEKCAANCLISIFYFYLFGSALLRSGYVPIR